MTTAAICATREVSWSPSFCGEQYDPDLGLYYLRARYMNPLTGRFFSRDPYDGNPADPATLHKYDYAGGDPVNAIDPTGRDAAEYAGATLGISLAVAKGPGVAAEVAGVNCAYNFLASETGTWTAIGLAGDGDSGTVTRTGPCAVKADDCSNAPPEPSNSPVCGKYGNEPYAGTSLQCFCKCAGDSAWSQKVRGCLACEHNKGTNAFEAHVACYAAAGILSTPPSAVAKCYTSCYVGFKSPTPILPPVLPPLPLPNL